MASHQSQMNAMEAMMVAMRQSMTDITTDMVNVRTLVAQGQAGINTLTATSTNAWTEQNKKIIDMQKQLDDLQADLKDQQQRSGGRDDNHQRQWHLEHKGTLKTYDGSKKDYRSWAKQ